LGSTNSTAELIPSKQVCQPADQPILKTSAPDKTGSIAGQNGSLSYFGGDLTPSNKNQRKIRFAIGGILPALIPPLFEDRLSRDAR
jgi:hypothetical protein